MAGFKKATKKQLKLRLALMGTSGSGKTFTSLSVARNLGSKTAVIDTEHGSASKYADQFEFDVCELDSFSPQNYINAIVEAGQEGYDTIIIDSMSHAWMGKDGLLEQVDKISKRSYGGNSFTAWKDANPLLVRLTETILASPCHIIATFRTKSEWVVEQNEKGKNVPKKIGTAPVFKDAVEYEFDIVGELNQDNELIISKTRCPQLSGEVIKHPGKSFANTMMVWLGSGESIPQPVTREEIATMNGIAKQHGWTKDLMLQMMTEQIGLNSIADLVDNRPAYEKMCNLLLIDDSVKAEYLNQNEESQVTTA